MSTRMKTNKQTNKQNPDNQRENPCCSTLEVKTLLPLTGNEPLPAYAGNEVALIRTQSERGGRERDRHRQTDRQTESPHARTYTQKTHVLALFCSLFARALSQERQTDRAHTYARIHKKAHALALFCSSRAQS